jgi:hypothetical protein
VIIKPENHFYYKTINNKNDLHNLIVQDEIYCLKEFLKLGILPLQEDINFATENNNIWTVNLLVKYNCFPEQKSINIAHDKGYKFVLNILSNYNLFPK